MRIARGDEYMRSLTMSQSTMPSLEPATASANRFSLWRSASSARLRSEISIVAPAMRTALPPASRKHLPARMNPANRAVAQDDPVLDLELRGHGPPGDRRPAFAARPSRRDESLISSPNSCARRELHVGRQVENFLHHRRHEQLVGGQVPDPVAFVRAGHRDHVALFRLAQRSSARRCASISLTEPAIRSGCPSASRTHRPRARTQCQLPSSTLHSILDRIRRRPAGKVRVHRFDASSSVVRMKLQRSKPFAGVVFFGAGRQAEDLARARRRKYALGLHVPVPDAVIRACHRSGESLFRCFERRARRAQPRQLAHQ